MNEALPASASTSARMLIAALALSPFLLQLKPNLRSRALLCGCFTALGYISQSISLVDTPAATVAFLGALTVVICPLLGGVRRAEAGLQGYADHLDRRDALPQRRRPPRARRRRRRRRRPWVGRRGVLQAVGLVPLPLEAGGARPAQARPSPPCAVAAALRRRAVAGGVGVMPSGGERAQRGCSTTTPGFTLPASCSSRRCALSRRRSGQVSSPPPATASARRPRWAG